MEHHPNHSPPFNNNNNNTNDRDSGTSIDLIHIRPHSGHGHGPVQNPEAEAPPTFDSGSECECDTPEVNDRQTRMPAPTRERAVGARVQYYLCCKVPLPKISVHRQIIAVTLIGIVLNLFSLIADDIQLAQIHNRRVGRVEEENVECLGNLLVVVSWLTICCRFLSIASEFVLLFYAKKKAKVSRGVNSWRMRMCVGDSNQNNRSCPHDFWLITNVFLMLLHVVQIVATFMWANAQGEAIRTARSVNRPFQLFYSASLGNSVTLSNAGVTKALNVLFVFYLLSIAVRGCFADGVLRHKMNLLKRKGQIRTPRPRPGLATQAVMTGTATV